MNRGSRKRETQRNQRAAEGYSINPRRLARSIAKAQGFGKDWQEQIRQMQPTGQKYLHPEKHRKEAER